MNGRTSRAPQLIVGISRSRASWWALAWATGEAQRRGARLLLVHVFRPHIVSAPQGNDLFTGMPRDPDACRIADGYALLRAAVDQAVGQLPAGVAAEQVVIPGRPAAELARLAHGGDVLVLGARHRGWLRRLAPGSVARACTRRTECLVVIVPEPAPSTLTAALPPDAARGHRHRWMPHREARTAS